MISAGRRSSRSRWDPGRVLAVLLGIAAIVAGGILGIRHIEIARLSTPSEVLSDDEIYAGSILLPSADSISCHQLLFDNRTGQFKDNGTVDCQKAYYRSKAPSPVPQWSSMRTQVIGESFRRH